MSWRDDAACRGDLDMRWIGDRMTSSMAKVCWGCPVRSDCLFEALQRESKCDPGIWGGTTEVQRRNIRKNPRLLSRYWSELQEAAA